MKKGLVSIAMLACVAFADNIINADGSINKESTEYKIANEKCINGCDYDDWTISQSLEYSLDGSGNGWRKSFDGNQLSEDKPLYIRLKSTIKTDHWEKSTQPSIPVVLKISAENGFKYFMTSMTFAEEVISSSGLDLRDKHIEKMSVQELRDRYEGK